MNKVKAPVRRTVINKPTATVESKSTETTSSIATHETFALTAYNYKLIGVGIGILILGYFLLSLEKFKDATEFSIALYVAPYVIIAGYAELIYAIMARPPKKNDPTPTEA